MKKNYFSLVLIFSVFLVVTLQVACDKKVGKPLIPAVTPTPEIISECDTITYTKHIKKIINGSCGSVPQCHTLGFESGQFTLDTYDEVKSNASKIKATVFSAIPLQMPPDNDTVTIKDYQKKLLNCWLNNGMKP